MHLSNLHQVPVRTFVAVVAVVADVAVVTIVTDIKSMIRSIEELLYPQAESLY
jgi:hypothetical protein